MTQILGHNYIGGQRSAQGSVIVNSVDATTGQALPYDFYQATAQEVDRAACAAAAAYPAYKALSAERRAAFLDAIADELDALDDQFVALVCRETALPAARIAGERGRTSGQMRLFATVLRRGDFYAARIDQAQPERTPLPRPDVRQYRIGLGPVAVFGASNFPLAFSTAGGIPLQRWRLAAPWCSRRTAGTWLLPNRWPMPFCVPPSVPACLKACST